MNISTLAEFNTFKISFSIKTQTMMDDRDYDFIRTYLEPGLIELSDLGLIDLIIFSIYILVEFNSEITILSGLILEPGLIELSDLGLIDLIIFSIYILVEFNSFKISFLIKTQTMIDDILLTLILRRRGRRKRNYSCSIFKTLILDARYFYQKRTAW